MKPPWTTAHESDHTFVVVRLEAAEDIICTIHHNVPWSERQGLAHLLSHTPEMWKAMTTIVEQHNAQWKDQQCLCVDCLRIIAALELPSGKFLGNWDPRSKA